MLEARRLLSPALEVPGPIAEIPDISKRFPAQSQRDFGLSALDFSPVQSTFIHVYGDLSDPSSGAWCGVNFIAATRLMMTNAMPVPR